MTQKPELSPSEPSRFEPKQGHPSLAERFPALAEAGEVLGMSGPALRKKFDRGDLPRKFLLRVGPRTLRVDIAGLVKHLKGQATQLSA